MLYLSHRIPTSRIGKTNKGFSLVELLVVVAILAILAAIAIPLFLNQKTKAKGATLRSDLHNLVMEMEGQRPDSPTGAFATGGTLYTAIVTNGKYSVTPGNNYNLFAVYPNCKLTGAPTPTAWTPSNGDYVIAAVGQTGLRNGQWTAPRYYYDSATGKTMEYGANGLQGITGTLGGGWSSVAAGGCDQITDIGE